MEYSIHDSVRKLATKLGADRNGTNIEDTLNNIAVKLGGEPTTNRGIAGAIDAITKVADIDDMHNMTTLSVTPTTSAQSITPESPVDGYSSVSVSAVTSAIDQNIVAGNIKKDVEILGVTGSYEGSGSETFAVTITGQGESVTANKTYSETMTAIQNGDVVSFTMSIDGVTRPTFGYFLIDEGNEDAIAIVIDSVYTSTKQIGILKWSINDSFEIVLWQPKEN